jgi:hypothetical protein
MLRLLLSLSIAAAVPAIAAAASASALPTGVWIGKVEESTVQSGGKATTDKFVVILDSCEGKTQLWTRDDDGKVHPLPPAKAVQSLDGTHLFYFMDAEPKQPDWEELHTFSILELNDERAWLLWTRAVNNRDLEVDNSNRYFQSTATGELKRATAKCLMAEEDAPGK